MEKKFFDVFTTLVVSDDDRELLEETKVTRLVSSSRRDKLNIYLTSDYIVPKDRIYAMEDEICRQYYPSAPVRVRIYERFTPSGHTAASLIKQYKGSLMTEAARINPAWTDLLAHADFEFPDDESIVLVLEDRVIARDMSDEILDFIEHAVNVRFGTYFKLSVSFKKKRQGRVIHIRRSGCRKR